MPSPVTCGWKRDCDWQLNSALRIYLPISESIKYVPAAASLLCNVKDESD
jgi:hypothetical protein